LLAFALFFLSFRSSEIPNSKLQQYDPWAFLPHNL